MARRQNESGAVVRRSLRKSSNPGAERPEESRDDSARVGRILRERARALGKAHREHAFELPSLEILMFRLGSANYGIPTSFVREVVSAPKVLPLPRASDVLLGICAVRGELLPVFDVLRLLDFEPTKPSPEWPLIVVGEKAPDFGLLAKEVFPSRTVPIDDILASAAGSDKHIVRGVTPEGAVILDGRTLLSDSRLFL